MDDSVFDVLDPTESGQTKQSKSVLESEILKESSIFIQPESNKVNNFIFKFSIFICE